MKLKFISLLDRIEKAEIPFEQLSLETRYYASPWMRFVRGMALGQYPTDYKSETDLYIRHAIRALTAKVSEENVFCVYANYLTSFILDFLQKDGHLAPEEYGRKIALIIDNLRKINDPFLYSTASAILFEVVAKLGLDQRVLTTMILFRMRSQRWL